MGQQNAIWSSRGGLLRPMGLCSKCLMTSFESWIDLRGRGLDTVGSSGKFSYTVGH
ncbi:hypothetical protein A1OC_02026 [Stenotrophomonas maltophilia Ab55555]|nr:hypothetical protein A1OC_02026 [Stenotrophomonas maltophilia Ab55555]